MTSRELALILVFVSGFASIAVAQTGTDGGLPRDVYPDSRRRLPLLKPSAQGVEPRKAANIAYRPTRTIGLEG